MVSGRSLLYFQYIKSNVYYRMFGEKHNDGRATVLKCSERPLPPKIQKRLGITKVESRLQVSVQRKRKT